MIHFYDVSTLLSRLREEERKLDEAFARDHGGYGSTQFQDVSLVD